MNADMKQRIERQIELLNEEQFRAKMFLNENEVDCTSAPFVIVKEYRDNLKKHIAVLKLNLED